MKIVSIISYEICIEYSLGTINNYTHLLLTIIHKKINIILLQIQSTCFIIFCCYFNWKIYKILTYKCKYKRIFTMLHNYHICLFIFIFFIYPHYSFYFTKHVMHVQSLELKLEFPIIARSQE